MAGTTGETLDGVYTKTLGFGMIVLPVTKTY
jgi:hypothetical protein